MDLPRAFRLAGGLASLLGGVAAIDLTPLSASAWHLGESWQDTSLNVGFKIA